MRPLTENNKCTRADNEATHREEQIQKGTKRSDAAAEAHAEVLWV